MKQSMTIKALACAAVLAFAQQSRADDNSASNETTAQASNATTPDASPWKIAIGPGAYFAPQYPGSRHMKVYPFPALDISYRDRIFSQGPDVLGINVLTNENYHLGASLSFDFQSRTASDDPHLRGLGNVDDGPKLRIFGDYTVWAFTGAVAVYQDISGNGQGTTASADLYASLPLKGWLFSVGPGLTWANAVYTRTLFGISSAQSAASGLPQYATGSGIRDVHMTFYATHDFSKHWVGSVNATLGRLEHYAGGSPITERRCELTTFAALDYRF
ncbi:outer membrane scaffolding protein for murein synthesis (MipA/OmpV family) [Paraburkholderia bannensis]|uniref:Outer membrane scaffolding protein for murein synthesis (MipA/OmpV family) n=1 Tax=Paraburkholderia bannensis TaxID=765414 RepID=A0A7W9TZU6_9BURK|nr:MULTISPECIES: MipA/OmpV family protein [Paraburkholderia]MBB3259447.1 outer membrane scaffolding protein for murein synthesis (MipA/OmpV family) [Paraburkholderia sp. WP4_3_2]MBB6104463.1 outer membrane scaffolding protein for murein synthesis (MipA/OmpV family) [Paraburkholderia bannensis]